MTERFAGIDVGERHLHCALLDADSRIVGCTTVEAGDSRALVSWCGAAQVVAIDAPEAPSTTPHAQCAELAPKFRAARCAEIELGRSHGSWVSWVAPAGPPFPAWMEAGFAAYHTLDHAELLEVYPYAAFRELAGGRPPPKKRTTIGRWERVRLLSRAGIRGDALAAPPSHDRLDALVAALVALERFYGRGQRVTCGHDNSAIWLPGSLA